MFAFIKVVDSYIEARFEVSISYTPWLPMGYEKDKPIKDDNSEWSVYVDAADKDKGLQILHEFIEADFRAKVEKLDKEGMTLVEEEEMPSMYFNI